MGVNDETKKYCLDVVSIRLKYDTPLISETPLCCPDDAVKVMGNYIKDMDREMLCIINLDNRMHPISCSFVGIGTINSCLASPREIIKAAILSNATSMILMHNHPSGDCAPSKKDIEVTKRMLEVCTLIDIPLSDHIIVGRNNNDCTFYSFMENATLDFKTEYCPDVMQHVR